MIKARCRTNRDEGKRWAWPTLFVAVPQKGDMVRSEQYGQHGLSETELMVASITHEMAKNYHDYGRSQDVRGKYDLEPQIIVELTTPYQIYGNLG